MINVHWKGSLDLFHPQRGSGSSGRQLKVLDLSHRLLGVQARQQRIRGPPGNAPRPWTTFDWQTGWQIEQNLCKTSHWMPKTRIFFQRQDQVWAGNDSHALHRPDPHFLRLETPSNADTGSLQQIIGASTNCVSMFRQAKKKTELVTRSICQRQRLLQFGTGIFNHGKSQTSIWSNSVHLICWTSEVCSYLLGNPALPRNQDEPHWTRIHEFTKLRFSRRTVNLVQNQHLWHFIKYLGSCNFRHLTLEINSKINPVLLTAWILNFVSIHWNLPHQWGKKALQASCPNINLLQFRCYR